MNTQVDLAAFLEQIYKEYSLYVLTSRAIPDWTGLKRSQIKCLWVADKHCRKFMKTFALTGATALHGGYHHDPNAMDGLIATLTQSFPGSNNYPLFEGRGSFGSQTVPSGIAASRYTEVKIHSNFDILFPRIDFQIVPASLDPENPEPAFLAPLLPIALVNGIDGIAVAYACKIYPRNIKHLISHVNAILNKEVCDKKLLPFFRGYKGKVVESEGKIILYGALKKESNETIRIVEVPFNYNLEKYKEFLFQLKERGIVKSIVDNSTGVFDISVKVPTEIYTQSEQQLIELFDLKMNLNENITIVGIDGNVHVFDNVLEYLKYFVDIRLSLYEKRKKLLLQNLIDELVLIIIRLKIHDIIEKIDRSILNREMVLKEASDYYPQVVRLLRGDLKEEHVISQSKYDSLVKEVVGSVKLVDCIGKEKKEEYMKRAEEIIAEREQLLQTTPATLYKKDLDVLLQKIS